MSCGLLWVGGPDGALRTGARPANVSSSAVQPAVGGRKLLIDQQAKILSRIPLDKVPVLRMGSVALSRERFDSHEGFVLSRVNGQWDVRSILKLCPMPEDDALNIFLRLLERKVIEFPG